MSILVNVVNQKMYASSTMEDIVAGSQNFVKFRFNLSDEWDDLQTFAQFSQGGKAYNKFLDDESTVCLPPEIGAGTCTLMLYGSRDTTIGTTNYLTLKINKNILVDDVSSTNISESLYTQLVTQVNTYLSRVDELDRKVIDLAEKGVNKDVIESVVKGELDKHIASGDLSNLILKDGSVTKEKLSKDVSAAVDNVDSMMITLSAHSSDIASLISTVPVGSVLLRYRGQAPNYAYLELISDVRVGDVFFCLDEKCFYMWSGTGWRQFGGGNGSSGGGGASDGSLPTKTSVGEFITAENVYTAPLVDMVLYGNTKYVGNSIDLNSTAESNGKIKTIVLGENLCTANTLNASIRHATFSTPTIRPITIAVRTISGNEQVNYKLEYSDGDRLDASIMETSYANGKWALKTINPAKPVASITLYNVMSGSYTNRTADAIFIGFGDYNDSSLVTTVSDGLRGIPVTDISSANYIDSNGQAWCCDTVDYGHGVYVRRIGVIYNYNNEEITGEYLSSTGGLSSGATIYYILADPVETSLSTNETEQFSTLYINAPDATIFNDCGAFIEAEYYVPLYSVVYDAVMKEIENRLLANQIASSKIAYITLLTSRWTGGDGLYSQVVTIDGVTANSKVNIEPSPAQLAVFHNKDIAFVTENDNGVVTVYCIGQKPTNDYTLQATITEVILNG